jgi:hypothetical protein
MTPNEYFERIGEIVGAFQNLESAIRSYLYRHSGIEHQHPDYSVLAVGVEVPENDFTRFESLGSLFSRYNEKTQSNLRLDPSLVGLRDTIAHGRLFAASEKDAPMHLVKFSRKAPICVEFNESIDSDWFCSIQNRMGTALLTVFEATQAIKNAER